MVGVPALTWCWAGPTSRIDWPIDSRRRVAMNQGPRSTATRNETTMAPAARKVM